MFGAPASASASAKTTTAAAQPPIPATAPSLFGAAGSIPSKTTTAAAQPPIPAAAPSLFGVGSSTAIKTTTAAAAPSLFGTASFASTKATTFAASDVDELSSGLSGGISLAEGTKPFITSSPFGAGNLPAAFKPSAPMFTATPGSFSQMKTGNTPLSGFGLTGQAVSNISSTAAPTFGFPAGSSSNQPQFGVSQGPMIGATPFTGLFGGKDSSSNSGINTKNASGSSQTGSEFVFGAALKDLPTTSFGGIGASSTSSLSNTTDSKYLANSFRNPRK